MLLFNTKEVYFGYSMSDLSIVLDVLSVNDIKHKYKVFDSSGSWYSVFGTRRGNCGSFGEKSQYQKQYKVYVHKDDYDSAIYLVHKELHK